MDELEIIRNALVEEIRERFPDIPMHIETGSHPVNVKRFNDGIVLKFRRYDLMIMYKIENKGSRPAYYARKFLYDDEDEFSMDNIYQWIEVAAGRREAPRPTRDVSPHLLHAFGVSAPQQPPQQESQPQLRQFAPFDSSEGERLLDLE